MMTFYQFSIGYEMFWYNNLKGKEFTRNKIIKILNNSTVIMLHIYNKLIIVQMFKEEGMIGARESQSKRI